MKITLKILLSIAFISVAQESFSKSIQDLPDNEKKVNADGLLDLNKKGLTSLLGLKDVKNPEEVIRIDLSNNYIKDVPKPIFEPFTTIQSIDLSHNIIAGLEAGTFNNLAELKTLFLNDNQIKEIQEGLLDQLNVSIFWLNNNKLETLPKKLTELKNLAVLKLNNNPLKGIIPEEIFGLANLKELDLSGIELTALPKDIEKLSNLKNLNISNNNIKALPKELTKLKNLEKLDITENMFSPNDLQELKKAFTKENMSVEIITDVKLPEIKVPHEEPALPIKKPDPLPQLKESLALLEQSLKELQKSLK